MSVEDLCKLGKEYLSALTCKCYTFLDKIWKLDILHAFLPLNLAKFLSLKNVLAFLAHPVYRMAIWNVSKQEALYFPRV